MVLSVSKFLSMKPSGAHRPMVRNAPTYQGTTASKLGAFNQLYTTFWRKFKSSPELYGIINILVTDILGDTPVFTDVEDQPLSKGELRKAKRFWRSNRMKETLRAILFDMFVTGDGYGWKNLSNKRQIKEAVMTALKEYSLQLKESDMDKVYLNAVQDEDIRGLRRFDYIPSSTVRINNDRYDILGYTQVTAGESIEFTAEEVLHFRLNMMDGLVQGYSPVESLFRELALLYFCKGNMIAYMENGGRPEVLYMMKDTQPGSDSYEKFRSQLAAFKLLENRNGGLLGTGNVEAVDLSFGKQKDMEYKELQLMTLSTILFTFNIPISRVPFLIGKAATSGDSGGMAESGYQSVVSGKQDDLEDILNFQFFEEFGWHIHLSRHYKQDKVREAQAFLMNTDAVEKVQSIYHGLGKRVNVRKINEIFDISDDDLEDIPEEENVGYDVAKRNQNMLDNMSVEKEPDNRKRADAKREIAKNNANNAVVG